LDWCRLGIKGNVLLPMMILLSQKLHLHSCSRTSFTVLTHVLDTQS